MGTSLSNFLWMSLIYVIHGSQLKEGALVVKGRGFHTPFPESPCDIITVPFSPSGHLTKVDIKLQEEKEA